MSATIPLAVALAATAIAERQEQKLPGPGDSLDGLLFALHSNPPLILKPLPPLEGSAIKGFTVRENAAPEEKEP